MVVVVAQNATRKRKSNMQIDKEKQFKKCRNCGYLKSFIIKGNGAEHTIELNRMEIQECEYECKRNNNYKNCEDFWNHIFFPKDLSTSEAINIQNKNREFRKNICICATKFIKWLISTIISFGILYFGYLNYIK